MKPRTPLYLTLATLVVATFLGGCNVSPENNPAFIKMSKKLDEIQANQKKLDDSIQTLYMDVDALMSDTSSMKKAMESRGLPAAAKAQLTQAESRLAAIEAQVKEISNALAGQKKSTEAAIAALKKKAPARTAAPKTTSATKSTSTKTAAKPAPKPKPKGFYYKVKAGDTLSSVAKENNVSAAELCRANRLPITAILYAGQSLFVPRS